MIKIKDYIFNENSIMQIDKCCGCLNIQVENGSIHIENATFEDIEWNYGATQNATQNATQDRIKELEKDYINMSNDYQRLLNRNEELAQKLGYDISNWSGVNKKLLLRNCVEPEVGLYILNTLESLKGGE